MCRKQKKCTLIDENINLWDRYSPLRPYDWFDEELDKFCNAVEKFLSGSREESIDIIEELRSKEMQKWYIEHAQVAGTRRNFILKKVKPLKTVKEKKRMPSIILERELNFRDGYRCRYCQRRILTKDFIKRFVSKIDYLGFRKGPRNIDTHGILLIHSTVLDHVVPHAIGGLNSNENLVTSCYPCNYGKAEYTMDQLQLENPMDREPICDNWDGLQGKVISLRRTG